MSRLIRSILGGASNGTGDQSRRDLDMAVSAFRESGDRWGLSVCLSFKGFSDSATGDFDSAATALEESTRAIGELGGHNQQRIWLAMVRVHTGELERAQAELHALMDETSPSQQKAPSQQRALARLLLADLARHRGDLGEATRQLELAAPEATDVPNQALYLSSFGHLAVAKGELDSAEDALGRALEMALDMPDMPMVAVLTVGMAQLRSRQGDPHQAAELL
ncbi:AfsR/SARP family transcriptional regulator, partial [Actinomadura adrarensis]